MKLIPVIKAPVIKTPLIRTPLKTPLIRMVSVIGTCNQNTSIRASVFKKTPNKDIFKQNTSNKGTCI